MLGMSYFPILLFNKYLIIKKYLCFNFLFKPFLLLNLYWLKVGEWGGGRGRMNDLIG